MERILVATLLILAICQAVYAQATPKQNKPSNVEQEHMQLERDWSAAYLKHDIAH